MHRRLLIRMGVAAMLAAPGPATAAAAPAAAIRVGLAFPLSGPLASTGAHGRAALQLAFDELNAQGGVLGRPLALVTADDGCAVDGAAAAARQLVRAGVSVVIGHYCSHASLVAAGIYEVAGLLMITPNSTHPRLTEEGRDNVFRLIGRDDRQGRMAGDLLATAWPGRRIAILHDGSTYGQGLAETTRDRLRQLGGQESIFDAYRPTASDHTAVARRLRQAGIEVVYVGGYGPDAARIVRAARELGDDVQLVGGDALDVDEFWQVAGPAGEGTIFSGRREAVPTPGSARRLDALSARDPGAHGTDAGTAAYAAAEAWSQAAVLAGTLDTAAVGQALRRGRFATVLGPVAFDDKGDLEGADWQWQIWAEGTHRPWSPPPEVR